MLPRLAPFAISWLFPSSINLLNLAHISRYIKSILFKSNLENSSSHKNFLNLAAYLRASSSKIAARLRKFLWLDEFFKVLLNKMDFSILYLFVKTFKPQNNIDHKYFLPTRSLRRSKINHRDQLRTILENRTSEIFFLPTRYISKFYILAWAKIVTFFKQQILNSI